jgi:hypothetical protein
MIVRRGNAESSWFDYGPTPAPTRSRGMVSGSIVVPDSTKYQTRDAEKVAAWNAKRATTRAGRKA